MKISSCDYYRLEDTKEVIKSRKSNKNVQKKTGQKVKQYKTVLVEYLLNTIDLIRQLLTNFITRSQHMPELVMLVFTGSCGIRHIHIQQAFNHWHKGLSKS